MAFLVLCPSCRRPVSIPVNLAGQPALCPYCAMAFKVPAQPQPPAPAVPSAPPSTVPPRPSAIVKKPAARPAGVRQSVPRSRKTSVPTPSPSLLQPEPSRTSGKVLFGVLSFGIVALILVVIAGVAGFVFWDRPAGPSPRSTTGRQVAEAGRKKKAPQATTRPERAESREVAAPLDNPPPAQGETERKLPQPQAAPKRKPEAEPALVENTSEPEPPPQAPAPKKEPPVKVEEPPPEPAPQVETPKPEAPAKRDKSKPDSPANVEAPKADPPRLTETPQQDSPEALPPSRRRLSGDEIYRRLVKSSVFIVAPDGSSGSGSLIHRERRLVLTNYHVVGDNSQVFVSFPRYDRTDKLIVEDDFYRRAFKNKEFIRGKVLKVAKGQDLALVQLDTVPEGTPGLKLAARSASPGQTVHSIGNPGASDAHWLYTSGTVRQVSHKTWKAKVDQKVLTFDAEVVETQSPTNPGDSGGPLVNDALILVAVTQGANVRARELSLFIDIAEVKKILQACDVPLEGMVAGPEDAPAGGGADVADVLALARRLQDRDAAVRAEAARRLGEWGTEARPAARALRNALKDDDPSVRRQAALALGKLGADAQDQVRPNLFAALRDPNAEVRTAALQALAELEPPSRDELVAWLSVLRESLARKNLKACLPVARALAKLGPEAKETVPELRTLLQFEDREIRVQVLAALRKIGPSAREAAGDVTELLKDEQKLVRLHAALVLAAIDPKMQGVGRDGLSVLILALKPESVAEVNDAQTKERVKEITAHLVKMGEPAAERLLRAIQNDFRGGRSRTEEGALNGQARLAALKIIAAIGPEAYSTAMLSALAELQRSDPYPGVREAARQAYAKIQNKN